MITGAAPDIPNADEGGIPSPNPSGREAGEEPGVYMVKLAPLPPDDKASIISGTLWLMLPRPSLSE